MIIFPSFSLAQRKEAKETSTLTKPSPIWEGLTAPTRRSFTKVRSGHQSPGVIFFSAYARSLARDVVMLVCRNYMIPKIRNLCSHLAPPHPRATEILWYSHSALHTPHSTNHFSLLLPPSSFLETEVARGENYHHFISILRNAVSSPAIFSCCQMLGCQLAP